MILKRMLEKLCVNSAVMARHKLVFNYSSYSILINQPSKTIAQVNWDVLIDRGGEYMKLFNRNWTRRELEARVGRIQQLAGVERFVGAEGPEKGVTMIRVRTGSGLSYWITPEKGMDIGLAEVHGVPISWSAGNGTPHPAYYDHSGANWLRSASGGLLMTCGLTQVGGDGEDELGPYGLHGRIHHTPAREVSHYTEWVGDQYVMKVRGVMEETSIFGERLRLTRTISSFLGDNRIVIEDEVENLGFTPKPHMLLYHFNFGFPLLDEQTEVLLPKGTSKPRDPDMDMEVMEQWQAPDPQHQEQVYYHQLDASIPRACASIHSPSFPSVPSGHQGLKVELEWDTSSLPRMVQWRMPGAGEHVLGLEPSNCWTYGRAKEREQGTLRMLEPGESINYNLELRISYL